VPRLLRGMGEALGWDYAACWWVDRDKASLGCGERWRRVSVPVPTFDELTRTTTYTTGAGLPGTVWASSRPTWVADAPADDDPARARAAASDGLHGGFAFPIRLHGEVLGVVEMYSRDIQPPDEALLAMAGGLGSQIGLFIERKRFESQLVKLSRAVEQSASLVIITDAAGRIEFVNPEFTRVTGYTQAEVTGRNPRFLRSGVTSPTVYADLWQTISSGREWRSEFHNRKKDGSLFWVSASISPVRDPQGIVTHFVAIEEDITTLKQAEEALRHANEELERRVRQRTEELARSNTSLLNEIIERQKVDRARQALSRCNQVLMRATDEQEFLREVCRVIVEDAGYILCWVGLAEHDEPKTVRPVAHAGYEQGYLKTVNVTWADTERGHGPSGTSIRTGQVVVVRDAAHDPDFAPWRTEALRRGYASVIGIPLTEGPEILGALTIYASEPDAFDDAEVGLLRELSHDLCYGLSSLHNRAERRRAREELRRAYDDLERRVAERTAELSRANELLKQEIAERERAEVALRSSERLYRQLTEGTRDAIVVADKDSRITLFNPAAQETFGYTEAEVLGEPLAVLMPPEVAASHEQAFHRFLETQQPRMVGRTVELQGRRKNGEVFPLEISLSSIELPEGIVLLGAIRDLTERRRLQAMVVQAEKLASLGLLSAGVAHEINNPLSYAVNNLAVLDRDVQALAQVVELYESAQADLAAVRPELAGQIAELSEEIDLPYIQANLGRVLASTRKGIKRVSDIVQNLRGFARLDQAAIDCVDLRGAISSSLDMIRGQLERRHITVEQRAGDLPPVVCAPAQINQVVLNLLVNAMQAIESTGRDSGRIVITTKARGHDVVLEVADDGCGIPEEIRSRVFDPFFTTKPIGQGTGLGLAISQGIVADHGGRIEFESTPGRGTTFRIILPVGGKGPATSG
jgi:two-component system NtrC family sensor kinase